VSRISTGSQFRFLYRNWCSAIVMPPLRAAGPVLDARGLYRLHHWLTDGKNTLVVGGGDANIAFINGNCIGPDGGFDLHAERVRHHSCYFSALQDSFNTVEKACSYCILSMSCLMCVTHLAWEHRHGDLLRHNQQSSIALSSRCLPRWGASARRLLA
jgi:hypothetical protein